MRGWRHRKVSLASISPPTVSRNHASDHMHEEDIAHVDMCRADQAIDHRFMFRPGYESVFAPPCSCHSRQSSTPSPSFRSKYCGVSEQPLQSRSHVSAKTHQGSKALQPKQLLLWTPSLLRFPRPTMAACGPYKDAWQRCSMWRQRSVGRIQCSLLGRCADVRRTRSRTRACIGVVAGLGSKPRDAWSCKSAGRTARISPGVDRFILDWTLESSRWRHGLIGA